MFLNSCIQQQNRINANPILESSNPAVLAVSVFLPSAGYMECTADLYQADKSAKCLYFEAIHSANRLLTEDAHVNLVLIATNCPYQC